MGIFGKPNIAKLKSKGDVKALRKELVSSDRRDSPDIADEAAVALLDLGAADVLREALIHDVSPTITRLVAIALRKTDNENACPILYDVSDRYADTDTTRKYKVQRDVRSELEQMPGAWLSSALRAGDDAYLQGAVLCVQRSAASDTRLDERTTAGLVACLRGQGMTAGNRSLAAGGLTGTRDAEAVAALVACLRDESAEVRAAAAGSLKGIDDSEAKAGLAACLRDESAEVRAAAAAAIGDDPRAVGVLVENLRAGEPERRLAAINALSASGSAEAVEPIAGMLADPDPRVRTAAAHGLAGYGDPRGRDILVQIAGDASIGWEDRARAVTSLGDIGIDEVPTLVGLLQDPNFGVKRAAAKGLAKLGWEPTMDEAGAYFFLATGDERGSRKIGAKATRPLMEFLPKAMYEGLNRFTLLDVAGEVADRRIVPTLEKMLKEAKESEALTARLMGGRTFASSAESTDIELLEKAIASILQRGAPVAGPEWISLMSMATVPLGQVMVVDHQMYVAVTCPPCGSTMLVRDAYHPGASFLVCPRCGDDWMIRYLTGKYERTDATPVAE